MKKLYYDKRCCPNTNYRMKLGENYTKEEDKKYLDICKEQNKYCYKDIEDKRFCMACYRRINKIIFGVEE